MAAPIVGAGPHLYGGRAYAPISQINVTPFVDVMLVLLVVFMVTAPLLTVGVMIDLPKTQAPMLQGQDEPLEVTVDAAGQVYVQELEVEIDQLVPRLIAITGRKPETRIFVRGDRAIDYGRVMEVMSRINVAGYTKVALVTEALGPAAERKTE